MHCLTINVTIVWPYLDEFAMCLRATNTSVGLTNNWFLKVSISIYDVPCFMSAVLILSPLKCCKHPREDKPRGGRIMCHLYRNIVTNTAGS